ncbi:MAG: hypothetical protein U1F48_09680 [Burkholderiales bacterium]
MEPDRVGRFNALSFAVSALIGVVFGFFPARRAAESWCGTVGGSTP